MKHLALLYIRNQRHAHYGAALKDIYGAGNPHPQALTLWAGLIPLLVIVGVNDAGNLYLALQRLVHLYKNRIGFRAGIYPPRVCRI